MILSQTKNYDDHQILPLYTDARASDFDCSRVILRDKDVSWRVSYLHSAFLILRPLTLIWLQGNIRSNVAIHLDSSGFVSVEEQDPAALRHFLDKVSDQPSSLLVHHRDSLPRLKNPTPQSPEGFRTVGLCWPILSCICVGDGERIITVDLTSRGPLDPCIRFFVFPFGSVSRVRCVSCWISQRDIADLAI